jgi:hypothetical protein
VVRRPPAVLTRRHRRPGPGSLALGVPLLALAYFLAAPALPALPAGDPTRLVAGATGLLFVTATTLSLLPARDTVAGPLLIALGSGLLVGALNAAGVGAGANVFEAMLAAAIGLLLARWLRVPEIAIAVPLVVAAIDAWSSASAPGSRLLSGGPATGDSLSFDLPAWGATVSAGQLGLSDAVFVALFAAWAWHWGFRRAATIAGLVLGLLASLVLGVVLHRAIPALPLVVAGYLLPNVDRVRRLLRHAVSDGSVEAEAP